MKPLSAAFARLCGAHGEKVSNSADLEAALAEALSVKGLALVEIMADAELILRRHTEVSL